MEKLSAHTPAVALAPVVGKTTAAVEYAEIGDARSFSSTGAFLKAMGLNLKEKSSGTIKGQLKLTKRGSSRVRQYLWLAVFRWIRKDPIANAWYQRKKERDGGKSSRAAVALMRKLAKAIYHVGRGATFDSSKPNTSILSHARFPMGDLPLQRNSAFGKSAFRPKAP